MKKELNLTKLNEMSEKELKNVKGGNTCGCSCYYAGTTGGSSFMANGGANRSDNLWSARGLSTRFVC